MWSLSRVLTILLVLALLLTGCTWSPEAQKARHLERGDQFFARQEYREAIIEYRNVVRLDGINRRAIRQLGVAHYQLGEMSQAFWYLGKSRELDPGDSEIRLKLGTISLLARRPEQAKEEAAFVLQQEPTNLEALLLWAASVNTSDEVDSAIRGLEAARA